MSEEPFTRIQPLIETLAANISQLLDKPFALFGHSMGAIIAFELTRYLRNGAFSMPVHLFVSGTSAPTVIKDRLPTYTLPDTEFIEELRRLNGTPGEILENPDLMELLCPLLRADFELVQTYSFVSEPPLPCPITAFGGLQDCEVSKRDIEEWHRQTTSAFSTGMLPGDHFFLNTHHSLIISVICKAIAQTLGILD